jgi:hypothetical protein
MVFYLKIIFKIIYFIFYAKIFEKSLYTTILMREYFLIDFFYLKKLKKKKKIKLKISYLCLKYI